MIKIAHVTSSLKKGGAEEVLCSLVEQLRSDQFVSHVVYFHTGPHVDRLGNSGVKLYHIRGLVCMYDPIFWWRLVRTLRSIKPDCIHALLWSAQCASRVIGRLLRIPVVTAYHNQATLESGLRLFLDRITLRSATKIVAVSNTVAQSITQTHSFVAASSITTIANGIDIQRIDDIVSRARVQKADLNIPADAPVIGTVGRLHPIKNHALLLQAYALVHRQHPNTYLILVGDGPEHERLSKQAQQLNLCAQVIFVTHQQAYPYYALFDCFVLPSAQEGMSLALLEAHYFTCASIVAHAHHEHDIIEHGHNGLLVQPNNAYELSQKISSVVSNKALQQRLGLHAHRHIMEKYTIRHMVQQYEQLFSALKK